MPIIKSAIKRAKQSLVRRSRNLQTKRAIKADVLAVHQAIQAGENTAEKLAAAYSELDRAVKKGTLHKNTAARRKSQLATAITKADNATPAEAEKKTTKGAGTAASKKTTAKKAPAAKATATKAPAAKKSAAKKTDDK